MNNSWPRIFQKNEAKSKATSAFARFCFNEEGAAAIEYGLIAALIAVPIILAITMLGVDLFEIFERLSIAIGHEASSIAEGSGAQAAGGVVDDPQTPSDRGEVTRPGGDRGNRVPW